MFMLIKIILMALGLLHLVDECATMKHACDKDPLGLAVCMNLDHGVTCKCDCYLCERFGIFWNWRKKECVIPAGKSKNKIGL